MAIIQAEQLNAALDSWANTLMARAAAVPTERLAVVGIINHGDVLARRLVQRLESKGIQALYGALDISLYRDDFDLKAAKPALHSSYLPFSTDNLHLVLVDDVMYTGRTARAALNAIFEYGRPARVEFHCLMERTGRQLPIRPDYVAYPAATPTDVTVHLQEIDGTDEMIF